ncbi:MAG: pentapeptide repeat-containing protein, partial [Anaerolineaceae bacterium]
GADLRWANLKLADLSKANLSEANLSGANLEKADLSGADLRGTVIFEVNLSWTDITGAIYDERTTWPKEFNPKTAGAVGKSG